MLTVVYDEEDKDVPCICVMKVGEALGYACLKMEIGEQAELLYRALTEQDFKIMEKDDPIKMVTNAEEAEEYQIREEAIEVIKAYRDRLTNSVSNQLDKDIEAFETVTKGFEEFTKMMFKQGQEESEVKKDDKV